MKKLVPMVACLVILTGCISAPKMDNPIVASKTIKYSWTETKQQWVGGRCIEYQDVHPFQRYITVINLDTNSLQWKPYSFYVTQEEFDSATISKRWEGEIPNNYGMWPMSFE